jgi:hypothetical protein
MAEIKKLTPVRKFNPESEKPILNWESPDKAEYKRGPVWYIVVIVISLGLLALLYYQKLWSGVALVGVSSVIFLFFSRVKPKTVKCAVYNQGVVINDKVYRYEDFKSFWVSDLDMRRIRFQLTGRLAGQATMPLMGMDLDQVTLFLSRHLPEDSSQTDDIVDIVNNLIKF